MKKLLMVLIVLALTVPAIAEVKISCEQKPWLHYGAVGDGNLVTVYYDATSEGNNVRAFALEIELIDNYGTVGNAVITGVEDYFIGENNSVAKGFGIFPGTIQIDTAGNPTSWGTPVAPNDTPGAAGTGFGTNKIVVEMGSLYTDANAPPKSGTLLKFRINNKITDIKISENTERGGVVMENPDEAVDVNAPGNGHAVYTIIMPGDICGAAYGPRDGQCKLIDYLQLSNNYKVGPPCPDQRADLCGAGFAAPDTKCLLIDYLALSEMYNESWK